MIRPRQKNSARAFDEGRAARDGGEARERCPYHPDQRPQVRAWEQGWDSLGPLTHVHVSVPAGVRARVTASVGGHFVPDNEDISRYLVYRPPAIVPCPACRRWRLDSGSQACVYGSRHKDSPVADFMCRACGERFKVPVQPTRPVR